MTVYQSTTPLPKRITGILPQNSIWTYLNDTTGETKDYSENKWGSHYIGTSGGTVTYKFPTTLPPIYYEGAYTAAQLASFQTLNAREKSVAQQFFQEISSVANINFAEATAADDYGQIPILAINDYVEAITKIPIYSDEEYAVYENLNRKNQGFGIHLYTDSFHHQYNSTSYIVTDDFFAGVIRHEIGHAIGLDHPAPQLPLGLDSAHPYVDTPAEVDIKYTMMAYNSDNSELAGTGLSTTSNRHQGTTGLQLYDIAALQFLYGANMNYKTGDDSYNFGMQTSDLRQPTDIDNPTGYMQSIWDAGGNDTLDISGGLQAADSSFVNQIDLQAGHASKFITKTTLTKFNSSGQLTFNNYATLSYITIAYGATIENAIGSNFADNIVGNDVANKLEGRAGNDTLDGGLGADDMIGGLGDDIYYVENTLDKVTELANEGTDTVFSKLASTTLAANVENLVLQSTGAANALGNAQNNVIYAGAGNNSINGGNGTDTVNYSYATSAVTVSLAVSGVQATGGSGSDTLTSIENLTGSDFADTLTGNTGNNVINGGKGADSMAGGAGDDSYYIDVAGDTVSEDVNAGTDKVYSYLTAYTLGDNVENLELLFNGNADGTGNALDNIITGNAFNNVLNGGLGANTLIGGLGDDTYIVKTEADQVIENQSEGTDIIHSLSTAYTLRDNVENGRVIANGTSNLTGNSLDNTIYAGNGNNKLNGGTGGVDTVDYSYSSAGVTLDLSLTTAQATGGSGSDTLLNFLNLTDSSFDDVLTGNSGNNMINGLAGNDAMVGGAGDDTYFVDSSSDSVTENANEGIDTVNSYANTFTLGNNIENGRILSTSTSNLSGNSLNNTIYAGSGNNVLNGLSGSDTVDYLYSTAGVTVTLASNDAQTTGGSGTDYVRNFENINGTAFNDVLTGNALDNILNGRSGADTMSGGAGNDIYYVDLIGDSGDQIIELANEGIDTVYLNAQSHSSIISYDLVENLENIKLQTNYSTTIKGNTLNNSFYMTTRIISQFDEIKGEGGEDTVDYSEQSYGMKISLDAQGNGYADGPMLLQPNGTSVPGDRDKLTSIEHLVGTAFNDTLYIVADGTHSLIGGQGNDELTSKGISNDLLNGGTGNDYLQGNIGNDTYIFNRGDCSDTIQEMGAKSISDDLLKFDSTVSSKQLWFKQSNNDLDIQIIGTTDSIKISGWYNSSESQIETFKTGDNKSLSYNDVNQLVNAMAGMTPPPIGQLNLSTSDLNTLNPVFTSVWK